MPPIQAVKFNSWNIPFYNRADPYSLQLRTSTIEPFRLDGGLSVFGRFRKPVAERTHTVTFNLVDKVQPICSPTGTPGGPAFNTMMSALLDGRGRLWFDTFDKAGPSVFSEADLNNLTVTPDANDGRLASVSIEWQIYNPILYRPLSNAYLVGKGYNAVSVPDDEFGEYGDERIFAYWDISASPSTITINNDGQMRTENIIIRIESLGVAGYTNPKVYNTTTEQWIRFGVTATDAHSVIQAKCDQGPHRVRQSSDDGNSFVDSPTNGNIWPNTTISDLQVPLMELIPGDNTIEITDEGTPNFRVMFLWLPAYGMI